MNIIEILANESYNFSENSSNVFTFLILIQINYFFLYFYSLRAKIELKIIQGLIKIL